MAAAGRDAAIVLAEPMLLGFATHGLVAQLAA
jgi:hypothetical protein